MTTGWNQGTGELYTPKQRLSFSEVPDRPCGRRDEAKVCYSGARNVGLETEMPQTDDSADQLPEAGQVRTSRNRHRAADYYTPVCSISRARYRPNNRSKSRSRTVTTGRHAGVARNLSHLQQYACASRKISQCSRHVFLCEICRTIEIQ